MFILNQNVRNQIERFCWGVRLAARKPCLWRGGLGGGWGRGGGRIAAAAQSADQGDPAWYDGQPAGINPIGCFVPGAGVLALNKLGIEREEDGKKAAGAWTGGGRSLFFLFSSLPSLTSSSCCHPHPWKVSLGSWSCSPSWWSSSPSLSPSSSPWRRPRSTRESSSFAWDALWAGPGSFPGLHLRLHPPILCQGSRTLLCSSLPRSLLRRRSPHKNTLRAPARGLCTFFIIIIITINQCSLSGVVSIHLLLRFTPWTVWLCMCLPSSLTGLLKQGGEHHHHHRHQHQHQQKHHHFQHHQLHFYQTYNKLHWKGWQ